MSVSPALRPLLAGRLCHCPFGSGRVVANSEPCRIFAFGGKLLRLTGTPTGHAAASPNDNSGASEVCPEQGNRALGSSESPDDHLSIIENAIGQVLEKMSAEQNQLKVPSDEQVEVESIFQDMMGAWEYGGGSSRGNLPRHGEQRSKVPSGQ